MTATEARPSPQRERPDNENQTPRRNNEDKQSGGPRETSSRNESDIKRYFRGFPSRRPKINAGTAAGRSGARSGRPLRRQQSKRDGGTRPTPCIARHQSRESLAARGGLIDRLAGRARTRRETCAGERARRPGAALPSRGPGKNASPACASVGDFPAPAIDGPPGRERSSAGSARRPDRRARCLIEHSRSSLWRAILKRPSACRRVNARPASARFIWTQSGKRREARLFRRPIFKAPRAPPHRRRVAHRLQKRRPDSKRRLRKRTTFRCTVIDHEGFPRFRFTPPIDGAPGAGSERTTRKR